MYSARACHKRGAALGLCTKVKNEWNKWKNHFREMKEDVGMSSQEKEREQEDAYLHNDRKSFITSFLHLCFFQILAHFM